jgi:hypothetical protein
MTYVRYVGQKESVYIPALGAGIIRRGEVIEVDDKLARSLAPAMFKIEEKKEDPESFRIGLKIETSVKEKKATKKSRGGN